MRSNPHKIRSIAGKYGWKEIQFDPEVSLIAFRRGKNERINVWYSKMTVGTYVKHPKMGKTQLFRRDVDHYLMENIFKKPRYHTTKGYSIKMPHNKDRWQTSNTFNNFKK